MDRSTYSRVQSPTTDSRSRGQTEPLSQITDYRLAISWTNRPAHVCNHRLQTRDLVDGSTYSRVCNHRIQTHDLLTRVQSQTTDSRSRGRIDLLTCTITDYRLAISWTDQHTHACAITNYRLTISWTDRPTDVCAITHYRLVISWTDQHTHACAITDYRLVISWTDRPTHACAITNYRLTIS